jgi:hypothetical protein
LLSGPPLMKVIRKRHLLLLMRVLQSGFLTLERLSMFFFKAASKHVASKSCVFESYNKHPPSHTGTMQTADGIK